ncbi:hypothetical protein [Mammaliicoccus sp. Dog046]|uniref:hypothetical protein n=1 Tax=Mammaliicoccus sp. Dog046 TaxID=3034233 RepID=UPI002B2619E4|nr:hypothetical protein [Mammaliicoccus sp. Dog046]WQK84650.1 hypothetical protein P3U32_08395 [Mammaliicoccus sp. Dog046]
MFIPIKNLIMNFTLIFLVGIFISYVGLTKTFDLSVQVSSVGGLLLGYSLLIPIKLFANYLDNNRK